MRARRPRAGSSPTTRRDRRVRVRCSRPTRRPGSATGRRDTAASRRRRRAVQNAGCRSPRSPRCARRGGGDRRSRAGFATAARSYASSAIRIPASPMAWISTCQPRRSASATKASRSSALHSGPPGRGVVDVRIEHGGRPRLDDAVGEGLEDAGVEPLPAAQVADEGLVAVERASPSRRACRPGASAAPASPAPKRAVVAAGPPQGDVLRFCPGLLDRRDPGACRSAIVRRIASRVDAVVGRGMCRVTRSWAPSLRTPVASPVAGRGRSTPSAGSGVSRSMPARRRAAVFAQPVWPSKQPMNAGGPATTASSWPRSGMPPGNAMYSQPLPRTQGAAGSAAACAAIAAWTASTDPSRNRSTRSSSSAPSRTWMWASSKPGVTRPPRASTTSVAGPRQSRRPSSRRPIQAIRPPRHGDRVGPSGRCAGR